MLPLSRAVAVKQSAELGPVTRCCRQPTRSWCCFQAGRQAGRLLLLVLLLLSSARTKPE